MGKGTALVTRSSLPLRRPVATRHLVGRAGTKWPRLAWTGPVVTGDFQKIDIDPGASVSRAATPTG